MVKIEEKGDYWETLKEKEMTFHLGHYGKDAFKKEYTFSEKGFKTFMDTIFRWIWDKAVTEMKNKFEKEKSGVKKMKIKVIFEEIK